MRAARRVTSSSSLPQHSTWAAEWTRDPGSRSTASQAESTRSNAALHTSTGPKGTFSSEPKRAASAGVRLAPWPPITTGG